MNTPKSTTAVRVKIEPRDEPPPDNPHFAPTELEYNSGFAPNEIFNTSPSLQQYHFLREAQFGEQVQQRGVEVLDSETGAIVPVETAPQLPRQGGDGDLAVSRTRRRARPPRSAQLVRVEDLSDEQKWNYRRDVRLTRLTYSAQFNRCVVEEEERRKREREKREREDVVDNDTERKKKHSRCDLVAGARMKVDKHWLYRDCRIVGAVPGVEIGDVFLFRMELCVVGLHGLPQGGIDFLPGSQSTSGQPVATSVIISGGYEDDDDQGDVVIYTGQGGQDRFGRQCGDQKLEGGNLALERSMSHMVEVRVIRGLKNESGVSAKVYVYDGLYRVVQYWFDVGRSGFRILKFKLVRMECQGPMGSEVIKFAARLRSDPLSVRPVGYRSFDISKGKERVPVYYFNDIDYDDSPLKFEYIAKTVFASHLVLRGNNADTGCDCARGCVEGCLCMVKNGGQYVFDQNGNLLKGKTVIFECGENCRCSMNCRNRVTQKGLKYRLEVFRSLDGGWGVRPLEVIPAGSFICEYAGVALTREQATILSMNGDNNLVYPSSFKSKWEEWGNGTQIKSDHVPPTDPPIPPPDFAIDVSSHRNVAFYISRSATPNIFVQFVLNDHNNLCFPRLMLFAMENIPPLRELSVDYGVPDESVAKLAICN